MTIDEILTRLSMMPIGAKASFCKYLLEQKEFSQIKSIRHIKSTLKQYATRQANCTTFLKRQAISDYFKEWRYLYGARVYGLNKQAVLEEYTVRLRGVWNGVA